MKIVLLIAILYAGGDNATMGAGFATMTACEAARALLPVKVAHHNATQEQKIAEFASACVEMKRAPQGTGV